MKSRPKPPARIEVPGGIVVVRPHGMDANKFLFWIRTLSSIFWRGYFAASGLERDIVILDASGARELYRDGPYDSITISVPLNRLAKEIEERGLEEIVRSWQIENAQLGPVQIEEVPAASLRAYQPYLAQARSILRPRSKGRGV